MTETTGPIVVHVDRDLEEMIPVFLSFRQQDIESLKQLLNCGNMQEIKRIGHNLKGSGGGYGFDYISKLGIQIESAALEGSSDVIEDCISRLHDYIRRVEVRFTDPE